MFAYLVLSHHKPALLARMTFRIRTLSPGAAIIVRHDARNSMAPRLLPDVIVRPSTAPFEWGHWSMVEALLAELAWITDNTEATHVVIVSGQDYPTRPLAEWESMVQHLDAVIEAELPGPGDRVRHLNRWYGIPGSARWDPDGVMNKVLTRGVRKVPRTDYRLLSNRRGALIGIAREWKGPPVYKGCMWMMLSRRAIDAVMTDVDIAPRFRRALHPDESYIQTVVLNRPDLVLEQGDVTFTLWTGVMGEAHPRTLEVQNLDDIRKSDAPFARKVDESPLLDHLDSLACK